MTWLGQYLSIGLVWLYWLSARGNDASMITAGEFKSVSGPIPTYTAWRWQSGGRPRELTSSKVNAKVSEHLLPWCVTLHDPTHLTSPYPDTVACTARCTYWTHWHTQVTVASFLPSISTGLCQLFSRHDVGQTLRNICLGISLSYMLVR